jgi:redox-sensitive bicupin YhaK (pirin superfamily)
MRPLPLPDPALGDAVAADAIEMIILPRMADVEKFPVRRALPASQKQMVGPFIFLDHFGPGELISGERFDVRPHPHIGLATVSYLRAGSVRHRDSIGSLQDILPGDVNWMTAGRGIAHSERSPEETQNTVRPTHGFQTWVALPKTHEEADPTFFHHDRADLPVIAGDGVTVQLAVGSLYGARAPVKSFTEMFFADVTLQAGARLPIDASHEERGIYLTEGSIEIAGGVHEAGRLIVLKPGENLVATARTPASLVLLGGEPMDGPRFIWWNFVASRHERIEQAKQDWKNARFDKVFGDEEEFIPLPEKIRVASG